MDTKMTVEQKRLVISVSNRLINTGRAIKQNLENELSRGYGAITDGVSIAGVSITAEQIQSHIGDELWTKLQEEKKKIQEFLNDF